MKCQNVECEKVLNKGNAHCVHIFVNEDLDGYFDYEYVIQCHRCLHTYAYTNNL